MCLQHNVKATAIVVAAGKGKRMGANYNKQFIQLRNKPILAYTLEVLQKSNIIQNIILVVGETEVEFCKEMVVSKYTLDKVSHVIPGGSERKDSVQKGLLMLGDDCDVVLVQDGARPFLTEDMINMSIETAMLEGAVIVAVPVKDTIKIANDDMEVVETLERSRLWAVQTPQTFKKDVIIGAYQKLGDNQLEITDDASVVEGLGIKVKILMGNYKNIKITTPEDLLIAEEILKRGEL